LANLELEEFTLAPHDKFAATKEGPSLLEAHGEVNRMFGMR
jgi:hypothetical protein